MSLLFIAAFYSDCKYDLNTIANANKCITQSSQSADTVKVRNSAV